MSLIIGATLLYLLGCYSIYEDKKELKYYLNEENWLLILKSSYYDATIKKKHIRKMKQRILCEREYSLDIKRNDCFVHMENVEKLSHLLDMVVNNTYEEELIQLSSFDRYLDDWDHF